MVLVFITLPRHTAVVEIWDSHGDVCFCSLITDHVGDRREGINQAVTSEVSNVFKGKTTNQLLLLEEQIHKKLRGGEGVDIGYWESLLQQLKAHMAKTRLRERHQEVLRQKLFKLKQEVNSQPNPNLF